MNKVKNFDIYSNMSTKYNFVLKTKTVFLTRYFLTIYLRLFKVNIKQCFYFDTMAAKKKI